MTKALTFILAILPVLLVAAGVFASAGAIINIFDGPTRGDPFPHLPTLVLTLAGVWTLAFAAWRGTDPREHPAPVLLGAACLLGAVALSASTWGATIGLALVAIAPLFMRRTET